MGIYLTTRGDKANDLRSNNHQRTRYIIELILGSLIGYGSCTTLPKIPNTVGWSEFSPQALGMVVAAIIISLIVQRNKKVLLDKYTLRNIVTGLSTGIGTFGYLTSLMINGVSTSFTLSQMSTVVGTLGGIIILREHKSAKALIYTLSGLIFVVVGGVVIGSFK